MSTPVLDPTHDREAELLLEGSRARAGTSLDRRELAVEGLVATTLVAVAVAMAVTLPGEGNFALGTSLMLVLLYALAREIGFEIGTGYTCPLILVLVPMLFLVPAPLVPAHVAAGLTLGAVLTRGRGRRPSARVVLAIGQSWHAVGPALVFIAAGVTAPDVRDWPAYVLALASMVAVDIAVSAFAEHVGLRVPLRATVRPSLWVYGVDAALAPIGFAIAHVAADSSASVLLVMPLMGLLWLFARERSWRIDQALELSGAYRGTALLLGDVVRLDHEYTGSHSRDVVELSLAAGEQLRLDPAQLRNLEFAALLHDVGKIAVPKEIINKPGPLDDTEWEVMRRHTIEGQRMLDSVGGVLASVGVIVRASHEDYDGTGYPDGLAGDAIPIESRICSACDAFSAMTTARPYRQVMSEEQALGELRRCAGTQFDPLVVAALARVIVDGRAAETEGQSVARSGSFFASRGAEDLRVGTGSI
jgi:HD-GYP domain-containing protein (c-di-GMP phosphodiesterase class II)